MENVTLLADITLDFVVESLKGIPVLVLGLVIPKGMGEGIETKGIAAVYLAGNQAKGEKYYCILLGDEEDGAGDIIDAHHPDKVIEIITEETGYNIDHPVVRRKIELIDDLLYEAFFESTYTEPEGKQDAVQQLPEEGEGQEAS